MTDLLDLIRQARNANKHQEAYRLATTQHDGPLTRELKYELAISAWYAGDHQLGIKCTNEWLLEHGPENKTTMQGNLSFYVKSLTSQMPTRDREPAYHLGRSLYSKTRNVTNPSVVSFPGGYFATTRTVNYVRDPQTHRFSFLADQSSFVSETWLHIFDNHFNLLHVCEIVADRTLHDQPLAIGIEDARLFLRDDQVWIACTLPDVYRRTRTALIQVGPINPLAEFRGEQWKSRACHVLEGPPNRHEKNWIPLVADNKLYSIYSFEPLAILEPDLKLVPFCHSTLVCKKSGPWDLSRCRGGSPGISWPIGSGRLLFLVHEVDKDFHYLHRFVILDEFNVVGVTIPFYFEVLGIEYAAGLTYTLDEKHVLIAYGLHDSEAKCQKIRVDDLEHFINKAATVHV